jgi:hypothetical protein
MANISNLQRQTFNQANVTRDSDYTVATFRINRNSENGGISVQNPYSLFKVQANWYSGNYIVNSELCVNQFITNGGGGTAWYLPEGYSGTEWWYPINGAPNRAKYVHLLSSDSANVYNYFSISFGNITSDGDYFLIDIIVHIPNIDNGNLMVDSSCYILNTV